MNLSAAYLKKKEEWREEVKEEIVINLLRAGATPEFIANAVGLPIAAIEKLHDDQRSVKDQ